ncbi:protein CEPU-1 isoform X4 [Drosophila yakuba]|uniref:protein CEPU-1 isoform X4 n=1 Tax=Drosophila yakuba TaxID=7245 RepID=UPI0019308AA9|nr:protein CEPU-1 isoform X4 [Drosophila yakuba]
MKVFLTFRIFLCILILRETCPQHLRENGTVTDLYLISEENIDQMRRVLDRGPYFDTSATKNVTSLVGKTGHLNCRIKNLGNKTRLGYNRRYLTPKFSQVSWIRHRDLHLLTVSESTYTSDQRFTSIYNKQTGDWSLQIKFSQLRDSGIYECQVSTTPPVGYTMVFSVVEPITSIPGGPEIYIDLGSTVNLTCVIKHLPDPPTSVQWNHNNQVYWSTRMSGRVATSRLFASGSRRWRTRFVNSHQKAFTPPRAPHMGEL